MRKGVSFDEGLQLAVGYNLWLNRDFRMEGANGDLIKRWATLPYLFTRPKFVSHDDLSWKGSLAYSVAHEFFFELGNLPEMLLAEGRAMAAVLGIATGLLVFFASRRLFGYAGALVSLTCFVTSASMLAFGAIVSTDMSITLTLFASTLCIWHLLHEISARRLLVSLVWFGLLVLAKPSALVILPVTVVLIGVKLVGGRPLLLRWRWRQRTMARRGPQVLVFAGCIVLHAFAGWFALWAHYDFRYSASPVPADATVRFFDPPFRDSVAPSLAKLVAWMERTHAFPEGFHRGADALLGNDDTMGSFMGTHWRIGGQWLFFPYAIWVKTNPKLWLALALGAATWVIARRRGGVAVTPAARPVARFIAPAAYELVPFVVLCVCYLGTALFEDLNIGHRHVLPIYPCLYVLAGASAGLLELRCPWPWRLFLVVLATCAIDSDLVRPNYLAYFAPQVGGARDGYRHLVDSSLDWGMNLPALKQWIDERDPRDREPLFLAYFGTDDPEYHGIKSVRLPGFFDSRPVKGYALTPGTYIISASLLQGVYTAAFGAWNAGFEARYQTARKNIESFERARAAGKPLELLMEKPGRKFWLNEFDLYDNLRFARLCAWLRHRREPDDNVGHALLIWKLSLCDLEAALLGPPAELTAGEPLFRPLRLVNLPRQ